MAYYSEQDPLLPKDKQSPEIQGSRPQSLNNVVYVTETERNDKDEENQREGINNLRFFILLIFLISAFALLIWVPDPSAWLGDTRPEPKTIEERVNRILSDTPLIGISIVPQLELG